LLVPNPQANTGLLGNGELLPPLSKLLPFLFTRVFEDAPEGSEMAMIFSPRQETAAW